MLEPGGPAHGMNSCVRQHGRGRVEIAFPSETRFKSYRITLGHNTQKEVKKQKDANMTGRYFCMTAEKSSTSD